MPYLIGRDGTMKMSKSAGNTVNLTDSAAEMFGKIMSIPDSLILNYARLAAWLPEKRVGAIEQALRGRANPRDLKLEVAEAATALYHGASAARRAREDFLQTFSKRSAVAAARAVRIPPGSLAPVDLIVALGAAASRSEARRLVAGRALDVDGETVNPERREIIIRRGSIVRVGKKDFFRVR